MGEEMTNGTGEGGLLASGGQPQREESLARMKELLPVLRAASRAYYQEDQEMMSNREYDRLYDEYEALERETGIVLAGSPTRSVGYEAVEELPKERHESPMLSLDKTKSPQELAAFAGTHRSLLSWKLDGLTVVLTYRDGELYKAVTRGNGEVGEVVTNNARVFAGLPLHIQYRGELIIRGEAVISYADFEEINRQIPDEAARYKNPRNLCSGSVRQLNNEVTARRNVHFFAFSLVRAEGVDFGNSHEAQFRWLREQGFEVVEYQVVTGADMEQAVQSFAARIEENAFPSDGLVLLYDDIAYGQSLGRTAKFPRDSIAFKWEDETRLTRLRKVEWSASRTGLINPIAVFDPVELEGTTVSRASVHNVSIVKALALGIGDELEVYKANMIIPQIAANHTRSGTLEIPSACPVCQGPAEIRSLNGVESLYCTNPECQAKRVKSFALMASRDALNIEGLSEATLEKFIAGGFIHEYADLFHLDRWREEIMSMEGFGEKSYENLAASASRARHTTLSRVVYGLGIENIGLANARLLCREFGEDLHALRQAQAEALSAVDGIGPVIAGAFCRYFADERHARELDSLLRELTIEKEFAGGGEQPLAGKTFVITGKVEHFANRKELKERIEGLGGKVTGSVTNRTDYLINNDRASSSSKNKRAQELGIPIISEEEFLELAAGEE